MNMHKKMYFFLKTYCRASTITLYGQKYMDTHFDTFCCLETVEEFTPLGQIYLFTVVFEATATGLENEAKC